VRFDADGERLSEDLRQSAYPADLRKEHRSPADVEGEAS
jgi:hypothetical protein